MNLSHSYSKIKMFENCPKRYKYQVITREVRDQDSEATIWGSRVHEQLELRIREQKELPEESRQYEPLCKLMEDLAGATGDLLVEQKYTLNHDLQPTGWMAPDAWLRSILDVLIVDGSKAYVFDWKSGKRRPDETQLEMFALQVFKHYPEVDAVKSGFIWLKTYEKDIFTYRRKDANKLWAKLMERITRIHNAAENDVWPAKPSGLCPWCPAKNICVEARLTGRR